MSKKRALTFNASNGYHGETIFQITHLVLLGSESKTVDTGAIGLDNDTFKGFEYHISSQFTTHTSSIRNTYNHLKASDKIENAF